MGNQDGLPFLDTASPEFSTRSPLVLEARAKSWCARTPFGLAVLRHRDVGILLRDKRLRQGSYAWPDINQLEGSFAEFWKRSIISQEGERHRQLRNLAIPCLAPDHIAANKPDFDRIALELADGLRHSSHCEFMEEFSIPFAAKAICILLGMHTDNWHQISSDASDLGLAMGVECKKHEAVFNAACDRLMVLAANLIEDARNGRDNSSYVARLVSRFEEMATLEEQALLDMVLISIFGGVDTTRSQLGFAIAKFAEFPEQWQLLRENRDLVPATIEEIIRVWPTTTWATREAVEDFEYSGIDIQKGQTLHMLVHASATDPAICDNPEFDIAAKRKIHFGFGGGAHHCIGHLVARTDMASALSVLADTFKEFQFDGTPEFMPDSGNTSPIRLPISYRLA